MSISQLVLVSRETRTVLTASFLKTPKLRKWSIDQGNLMSKIEEELSTMAALAWAEWVWLGKSGKRAAEGLEEADLRSTDTETSEKTWRTRDLGIKWPQWHTLLFEDQVAVGTRVVCPQDVKKKLLKQARTENIVGDNCGIFA